MIGRFACYGIPIVSIYNDKLISIDENAFSHCQKLLSINLPNVTELNNSVFSTCDRLENATFLSLEVIGNNAFSSTIRMGNLYAPNVITVGIQSFYNAKKLEEINFPKLCDTIPKNAFRNCKYLKTLFVPKAETIETGVLDGCTSLNTIFAPNLKSTRSLPNCNNINIYLSNKCTELSVTKYIYNIIAPTNSYAAQWAKENGHNFVDTNDVKFTGLNSVNELVYTSEITETHIPLSWISDDWGANTINKSRYDASLMMLFDFNNDKVINAKDYAQLIKFKS